jgi:multisubunit Na+/H+ antiporter MnhB subunit
MIQFVALFICAVSAVFLAVSAFAIIELWLGEDSQSRKEKFKDETGREKFFNNRWNLLFTSLAIGLGLLFLSLTLYYNPGSFIGS